MELSIFPPLYRRLLQLCHYLWLDIHTLQLYCILYIRIVKLQWKWLFMLINYVHLKCTQVLFFTFKKPRYWFRHTVKIYNYIIIVLWMSFKTVLHPTQSPRNRRSARTESHKGTTAACQLQQKQSIVWKLHMLIKQRWLAMSKDCNLLDDLIGDFLNVGQKVCSKRRQVKPKMEALCQSIKGKITHILNVGLEAIQTVYMRQSCTWVQNTTIL